MASCYALALVFAACGGDDDTPPPDGGRDAPAPIDASHTTPPLPPALPDLTPCPTGWQEVTLDDLPGVVACEPWPEGLLPCGDGEARFPGDPACVRVGGPCPADGFAEDLPKTGTVLFVRAGSVGGDGSRALPFATIAEALAAAPDGTTVAIAPGSYGESIRITRPVSLIGACTDVVITHRSGIRVNAPDVLVSRLRVDGTFGGIIAEPSAVLTLRGVEVSGALAISIQTTGGAIDGEDVLVRDAVDTGVVLAGGSARFVRLAIVRNGGVAMTNEGGMLVVDASSVVDGTGEGPFPALLDASGVGATTVERSALVGNAASEMAVFDGAALAVRDSLIGRATEPGSWPYGITVVSGSEVTLERVRLERVRATALGATMPGSTIDASDVVVRAITATGKRRSGTALELSEGAGATASRLAISGATAVALLVTGVGSRANITDLTAVDTEPGATGTFGRAIYAQLGGVARVERAFLARHHEIGAAAAYEGSRLELFDLTLRETACASACPGPGIGVGSYLGASVTIERFVLEDNELVGLQLALDGEADLVDGVIAGHPVGVNVQVEGYDLSRLDDRVVYRDNGTNLDATSLPVPDPVAP